ncbi:MAG: hypothetical protein K6E21_01570 [Bacilli bacterium]|nr:hypothetical protein [Bacilli bacterium]
MINQKHSIKKTSFICATLSAGLLFGAVACEKNEFKVKDNTLLKKAETLYSSLETIANNEYKKAKGITDDVNYIKGLAAANCSTNDYMHKSEYYWVMFTDNDAISVRVDITGDNEEDCVNFINSNVKNSEILSAKAEAGEIYYSKTFEDYFLDNLTNATPKPKGSERYYIDANKPYKLLGFKITDDEISYSTTGTTGANVLFSQMNCSYSISKNEDLARGDGDEVIEDIMPITFTLITEYVKC